MEIRCINNSCKNILYGGSSGDTSGMGTVFWRIYGDAAYQNRFIGWKEADQERRTEIEDILKSIEIKDFDEWYKILNIIAGASDAIEVCQFKPFEVFLERWGKKNPKLLKKY